MKILYKLDNYFISDNPEEVTASDRVTLYGFYSAVLLISGVLAANLYL